MKYFVVIFAVIALASAEGDFTPKSVPEIKELADECLKQYPLSSKTLAKLWTLDIPNTPGVRANLVCLVKKIGIYSSDEGYDAEKVAAQYHVDSNDSKNINHIKKCVAQPHEGDEGEYVVEAFKCIIDSEIGKQLAAELEPYIPDDIRKIIDES